MISAPSRQPRKRWLASLFCSASLHGVVAGVIVAGELYLLAVLPALPPAARPTSIVLEAQQVSQPPAPPTTIEIAGLDDETWMARESVDVRDLVASTDAPQWRDALLQLEQEQPDEETSSFVAERVLESIAMAERQTPEENLDRLEQLSDRLSTVSTTESVDQMAASLKRLLGTEERATQPAADAVDGEFDFDTAQLHDILRDESVGEVRYTAILLDSAGRTTEAPLTAEEGESVYRVMQLMKNNPLLERVYRGVVLSLLDKLLKESAQR